MIYLRYLRTLHPDPFWLKAFEPQAPARAPRSFPARPQPNEVGAEGDSPLRRCE